MEYAPPDINHTVPIIEDSATDGLLLNTYRIEKSLASGGMGEVFKVRHVELDTLHAIKVIKSDLLNDAKVLALFRREADVLRTIRHDAVVAYEGFFRNNQGLWHLVMEYVDGISLAQLMKQRKLSVEEFYTLRDRLAAGLAAVHAKGIVHRDLSPENVVLPNGVVGNAKLIDFGIAKLNDPQVDTIVGDGFAGKVRYAAPEQLRMYNDQIGPYTDVYSFALLLAASVRGEPLYVGHTLETAILARKSVPDLADIPDKLKPQLSAMLQPQPANRLQDTQELLQRWPAPKNKHGHKTPLWRWLSVIVLAIAVLAGIGYVLLPHIQDPADPTPPPLSLYEQGSELYTKDQLDQALALWEKAWIEERDGRSALAIGKMYDPVLWGQVASPFSKANARQTQKWYQRADESGISEVKQRLQELNAWRDDNNQ